MNEGTPKTMTDAIANGIASFDLNYQTMVPMTYHVQLHIRDFLAQKFNQAILEMDNWRDGSSTKLSPEEILKKLWDDVK